MEVKILEDSKKKLVLELSGEGHGFVNVLKEELWNNKKTKLSGYNISHPLTASPKITIETDGNAKDILKDACKSLKKDSDAFLKAFKKAK